jgi:predicted Holliday junction resolvase-like endonuclease
VPDFSWVPPFALLVTGLGLGFLVAWLYALLWKARYTREIRQDSVQRSRATISGQVHEQLLPYLPDFPFDPKDVRFLGSPVDLVVFDGLNAGALQRIVLVEVKTGDSTLSGRERQVRDAVREGLVSWQELRRP